MLRFEFAGNDSLPRLSWCARWEAGRDCITVRHGPWVETGSDRFYEGAWDGDLRGGGFAEAFTFLGSGGVLARDGVVFASPTNMTNSIVSIRTERSLLVSNSLVFLLVEADDEPDPDYPHYPHDLLEHLREGIRKKVKAIPTRRGRKVFLHDCCNVLFDSTLAATRLEKKVPERPRDFASYAEMLGGSMGRVLRNASDPRRERRYQPLATLSRGYDSVAVAALASRLGCTKAIALRNGARGDPANDSGAEIGRLLGLEVGEHDLLGFKALPGVPDAEFCACPLGSDVVMSVAEDDLEGSVLLNGRFGDMIWSLNPARAVDDLRQPFAMTLGGTTMSEFRLRVGFIDYAVPFTAGVHSRAVHRISSSDEMKNWSVGGGYDRPIPRRLAEERGVPREMFGLRKLAGAHYWTRRDGALTDAGEADFSRFLAPRECPWHLAGIARWRFLFLHALCRCNLALMHASRKLPRPLRVPRLLHERYRRLPQRYLFTFQWGFHRIKDRYTCAVESPAADRARAPG